jgi:hypothetical protein
MGFILFSYIDRDKSTGRYVLFVGKFSNYHDYNG